MTGNNLNTMNYTGARLSALYKFNENWDILVQQNYQNSEADGYFYTYPKDANGNNLGSMQLAAFAPAYSKDKYSSTAWTINGAFAGLKAVYTGSYMTRSIDGQQDYSNYMRSNHGAYYACSGKGASYFYFRSATSRRPATPRWVAGATRRRTRTSATSFASAPLRSTACGSSPARSTRSSSSMTT